MSHFAAHFLIFSSSAESFFTVSCLRLTPAKYVFSESLKRVDDEDVFFKYLLLKIAFNFNCTEAYISSYHIFSIKRRTRSKHSPRKNAGSKLPIFN